MGCAGYNENDVIIAIKSLRRISSEKGLMDVITKVFLTSADYHESVSRLSGILKMS